MSTGSQSEIRCSPKRKRSEQLPDTFYPLPVRSASRLDTVSGDALQARSIDDNYICAESSPRTQVASSLRDLDLREGYQSSTGTNTYRKKNRYGDHLAGADKPEQGCGRTSKCGIERTPGTLRSTVEARISSEAMDQPGFRKSSPGLGESLDTNFWHDSEITGHNPDDPNDDLYGINGIGFQPSPAIAWARSQKRKKQLADYKSREAREARERRSERRDVAQAKAGVHQKLQKRNTRVRFEHG